LKIETNSFLSKKTSEVFELIDKFNFIQNFTLVGGSGLAYYLNHRLSEDLDYFTWNESLDKKVLDRFLLSVNKKHEVTILNQSPMEIDLLIDEVKITFFANDWSELKIERNKINQNTYIGNMKLLAAMKVNTLSMRAKFRDYYDLYVLCKEKYSLAELFKISKNKLPGLTKKIFMMQISYIEDIDDENIQHLNPKYKLSLDEIHSFFEEQIVAFLKC
jgi:hypothetical protein